MFHRLTLTAAFVMTGFAATAQDSHADKAAALFEALQFPAMLDVMQSEGIVYGAQIGTDLFPGRSGDEWAAVVATVYDTSTMRTVVEDAMADALADSDIDAMLAFFTTEPGRTLVQLEVSARSALMDEAVDAASKEAAAIAMQDETVRYLLVKEFVDANDLVETNVVGALNANYAFYIGLLDGGAFGQELSEDQILTDVWSQEAEIRNNTTEWVYSFLMMAYQPVSDADLEAYVAFSKTDAGKDLNQAMFVAFDEMFVGISRALGRGASQFMSGAEL